MKLRIFKKIFLRNPRVDDCGTRRWHDDDGLLHRDDGPAMESRISREWYCHGKRHRIGGPANITSGKEEWWVNGELHREDGPAISCADGSQRWIQHGRMHRIDGPAWMEYSGEQRWYFQGQQVRSVTQDPATQLVVTEDFSGTTRWMREDGTLHRENGPAEIRADGSERWCINGVELSTEETEDRKITTRLLSAVKVPKRMIMK
jgi:hypothetical protein